MHHVFEDSVFTFAKDEDGDPYTPERLIAWLRAKYARHHEREDVEAARLIDRLMELEAEKMALRGAIAGALSFTGERHRAFTDPDIMGEMVSIRLSGLCLLAEALEPGCRKRALARWLAEIESGALRGFDPAI